VLPPQQQQLQLLLLLRVPLLRAVAC